MDGSRHLHDKSNPQIQPKQGRQMGIEGRNVPTKPLVQEAYFAGGMGQTPFAIYLQVHEYSEAQGIFPNAAYLFLGAGFLYRG